MTKNNILVSQVTDIEESSLSVLVDLHHESDTFLNRASLVMSSIYIVDRNGLRKSGDIEIVSGSILGINE